MNPRFKKILQWVGLGMIAIFVFLVIGILMGEQPAHALPEYATRTGESCGVCHVNPGGGGPRTLRGLLWSAQGNPDQIPVIDNLLIAPGVEDGLELYDIACAGCHGTSGEGLFGLALVGTGLKESKIQSSIERGRERSGMPPFAGQFTEAQLDALVDYVYGLGSGKIEPPPASYPLESAKTGCVENGEPVTCGGN
jgi:mono/diheme cytochrome c family protein